MATTAESERPAPRRTVLVEKPRRSFYQRHERVILGGVAVVIALGGVAGDVVGGQDLAAVLHRAVAGGRTRFVEEWTDGRLKQDMIYSGRNFIIGVSGAIAVGVVVGVIIGWYRRLAMVVEPFVTALYSTPRVALIPLVLIWFGIGMWSKVFIVFINAVFPVLINTIGGVKAIDDDLLKAARAYRASDWQIFTTVVDPRRRAVHPDRRPPGRRARTDWRRRRRDVRRQRGHRLHGQLRGPDISDRHCVPGRDDHRAVGNRPDLAGRAARAALFTLAPER